MTPTALTPAGRGTRPQQRQATAKRPAAPDAPPRPSGPAHDCTGRPHGRRGSPHGRQGARTATQGARAAAVGGSHGRSRRSHGGAGNADDGSGRAGPPLRVRGPPPKDARTVARRARPPDGLRPAGGRGTGHRTPVRRPSARTQSAPGLRPRAQAPRAPGGRPGASGRPLGGVHRVACPTTRCSTGSSAAATGFRCSACSWSGSSPCRWRFSNSTPGSGARSSRARRCRTATSSCARVAAGPTTSGSRAWPPTWAW